MTDDVLENWSDLKTNWWKKRVSAKAQRIYLDVTVKNDKNNVASLSFSTVIESV